MAKKELTVLDGRKSGLQLCCESAEWGFLSICRVGILHGYYVYILYVRRIALVSRPSPVTLIDNYLFIKIFATNAGRQKVLRRSFDS